MGVADASWGKADAGLPFEDGFTWRGYQCQCVMARRRMFIAWIVFLAESATLVVSLGYENTGNGRVDDW